MGHDHRVHQSPADTGDRPGNAAGIQDKAARHSCREGGRAPAVPETFMEIMPTGRGSSNFLSDPFDCPKNQNQDL